jgi:hypothetical protein
VWVRGERFPKGLVYSLVPPHSLDLTFTWRRVASASFASCHLWQKPATGESMAQAPLGPLVLRSDSAQDIIERPPHIQVSKGSGSFTLGDSRSRGRLCSPPVVEGWPWTGTMRGESWPTGSTVSEALHWLSPRMAIPLRQGRCLEGKGSDDRETRTSQAAR